MNSKNLRGLREAYSEVYAPQELDEIDLGLGGLTSAFGNTPEASRRRQEQVKREKSQQAATGATNQRAQLGVVRTNKGYIAKPGATSYDPNKGAEAIRLANRLNKETGLGKPKPTTPLAKPAAPILPPPSGRNPPTPARASSGGSPAPRPASGPVLSKKGGVEGTGVGSNFKARAFTNTEKSRYASVAAQNTTRGSASSPSTPPRPTPTAAPAKPSVPPTGTTAGGTKYQIRTPTSAEMAAARAAGGGEAGVRAAVTRSQPTTGASSASINKQDVASSKSTFTPRDMNMNKNPLKASFEWGSTSKLVDGIANAYSSIYEAKKVDQDKDGDNDFADVRIARLIASGVSKEEAIRRVKDKSYNEEVDFVNEKYMGFKALKASIAAKGGVRDPGAVAASIGRKKYGKEKFQKAAATDHKLGEDLELWVNELVNEGYDLSDYTWDEMAEIYEETELGEEYKRFPYKKVEDKIHKKEEGNPTGRGTPQSVKMGTVLRHFKGGNEVRRTERREYSPKISKEKSKYKKEVKLGEDFELWVNELVNEGYDLSDYTWDEMAEIYEETAKEKEERIAARRARLKEIEAQGRVMTSSKRTSQTAAQRRAEKKAEALERAAEAILNQTRGPGRVSNKPMGSQAPAAKEAPPEANRRLKTGLKRDTLGTAADDALKSR